MKKSVLYKNDFSEWYNHVIQESELSECSDVRGCMILKPYGYSLQLFPFSQLHFSSFKSCSFIFIG